MLDLKSTNVRDLAEALEDHSDYTAWWLDPDTGEVEEWPTDTGAADVPEEDLPAERGWRLIEPLSSRESYADMADFADAVVNPQVAGRLHRAITGRGAFRRFKDELWELGELRDSWFAFHNARMIKRAVEWLVDEQLVSDAAAESYLNAHPPPDQPELAGPFDIEAVSGAVAHDLRQLYGPRIERVLLFGSWARGDATEESDVDLLVVLEGDVDPIAERRRMADVVWQHSLRADRVVSVVVASQEHVQRQDTPFLARIAAEGQEVA